MLNSPVTKSIAAAFGLQVRNTSAKKNANMPIFAYFFGLVFRTYQPKSTTSDFVTGLLKTSLHDPFRLDLLLYSFFKLIE